ncbi:TonB-dependent receptor domain-containing protein [Bradyrhizobium prioriisuperbiae]|uniref:TonB-dependent receptor domain-containing protein n=1 Tax=Bradyrhizobium prioriisuperbiae TaxID=2854389 RepID=UPI0028E42D24|nr:TonB-dependent receptor [Bradyrhizobium prioritasuperba]
MRFTRLALLSSSALALVSWSAVVNAQVAPEPSATPAAQAPQSQPDAQSPSSAASAPAASPSAPAEIDIPQVNVEGRQPKPARRVARAAPAPRFTPPPTAPAQAAPVSPFPAPSASLSGLTSSQLQSNSSGSFSNSFFTMPGATSAGLSAGSARPVLRGLADAKVRIQENGVGTVDVADIAQDHGVPIDPLALQSTEVFRGPGALRFGSQAVGGVVEATNNRIPTAVPVGGLTAEMRSAVTTVNRGWESGLLLDAGAGNFAVHADVYGRQASDYSIPSYPYLVPPSPAPAFTGKQPNSAMRAEGAAVGGSYLFDGGYVGAAISTFTSDYYVAGIATAAAQQHNRLQQTKVTSKGEYRPDSTAIAVVRYWAGYSDYKHDEVSLGSLGFEEIGATFKNRQWEGKAEVESAAIATPIGAWTSIAGVQGAYQKLDTFGQAILLPAQTATVAGYLFEEVKHTDSWRTQVAGRVEDVNVAGTAFLFPSSLVPPPNAPTSSPADLNYTPKSISVSTIKDLPWSLVASLTAQRIERAPRALELFASGPDDSEKTFKIGNSALTLETAKTVEAGLKRIDGDFRFDAKAYYTRYDNFIFGAATGKLCQATFDTCGTGTDYIQVFYSQRDAIFRGGEIAWQWDLAPFQGGIFGIDGQFDLVRATFTDGSNVPRVPPMRLGGGAYWRNDNWFVRVGLLHAFTQNDFSEFDTSTPGYDLLKLQIEHRDVWRDSPWGPVEVSSGVVGDNLLNADVRNSVQFHKDEILQPGRGFKFFMNVKYGADKPSAFGLPVKAPRGGGWAFREAYAPAAAWWGGGYVGANAGYGWGRSEDNTALANASTGNLVAGGASSFAMNAATVGGQGGYNWVSGRLLAGLEGDIQYAGKRTGSTSTCAASVCNPALAPLDASVTSNLSHQLDWVGTLRGRLGTFITPAALAYVTMGVPVGSVAVTGNVAGYDAAGNVANAAVNTHAIRTGWTIGAGLETKIAEQWSVKLEYLHTDLGSLRVVPQTPINATVTADFNARLTDDIVRFGVNYKFAQGGITTNY